MSFNARSTFAASTPLIFSLFLSSFAFAQNFVDYPLAPSGTGIFSRAAEPLVDRISTNRRADGLEVYDKHHDVSGVHGKDFSFFHRLCTFTDVVPGKEIDALMKAHSAQILDPTRLRQSVERIYARQGKKLSTNAKISMPALIDGLKALLQDRPAFTIWSEFLSRGGTLDFDYGRYTPKPLKISGEANSTSISDGDGKRIVGTIVDTQTLLMHEALHFMCDLVDSSLSETNLFGAPDHRAISVIEDRIRIMRWFRNGQAPFVGDHVLLDAFSLSGDKLFKAFKNDDRQTFHTLAESTEFFSILVEHGAPEPDASYPENNYVFTPAEIADIRHGYAVNAGLLQQGMRLAAAISAAKNKTLEKAFSSNEFKQGFADFAAEYVAALDRDPSTNVGQTAKLLMDRQLAPWSKKTPSKR